MNFYIRRYREADQEQVVGLWYKGSLASHSFLDAKHWDGHEETIRSRQLPGSEIYLAEEQGEILGFIALTGNYISGLFIAGEKKRQGVGRSLVQFAHRLKGSLFVDVYQDNHDACQFYQQTGFSERKKKVQPETGHTVITLYLAPATQNREQRETAS